MNLPTHSFDPNTRVLMADGSTRPISEVNVGDTVATTDPATGQHSYQQVTLLHANRDTELTDVTVSAKPVDQAARSTGEGEGERSTRGPTRSVLHTTAHHPFWDATTGQWVDAADLTPGESMLVGPDGQIQYVTAVRNFTGAEVMRDLTVATTHTYYAIAGTTPVLVHNNNLCGNASTQAGGHVDWVNESNGPFRNAARQRAANYEMGTPGRRVNPQTGQSSVPRLSMPGRDGDVTAKFDGLSGDEVIDRKNGVLPWTSDSMKDEARRQSATSAYHGLQAVWEVPSHSVAADAQRWLSYAGVSNINVRVAP